MEQCLTNYYGRKNYFVECFSAGDTSRVYGWVFCRRYVFDYPDKEDALPFSKDLQITLDYPLVAGTYSLKFYDTLTGKAVAESDIQLNNGPAVIRIPPFRIDTAFKLTRRFFCSKYDPAAKMPVPAKGKRK